MGDTCTSEPCITHPNAKASNVERTISSTMGNFSVVDKSNVDIEHMPVVNDPRTWSSTRKNVVLTIVSATSMIAGLACNIQNPSIADMEADLPATSAEISLSLSFFILIQGLGPLVWTAISEIKGRKLVYLVSLAIFTVGSVVVAISKNIGLVIGFRCLQATGSSSIMAIGAATLADIFDPVERGTRMGIFYAAQLLGPSLGPILGGVLTTGLSWRASFWFLAIVSGLSFMSFLLFFDDTFRRERSRTYQDVLKRRAMGQAPEQWSNNNNNVDMGAALSGPQGLTDEKQSIDTEKQDTQPNPPVISDPTAVQPVPAINLSLSAVNPLKPLWLVLRRWNNFVSLVISGLLFAFCFVIVYTSARTLGSTYHYNPLKIGLVLLTFGIGSIAGSILGGRWSDRILARMQAENGRDINPEKRLRSTVPGVCLFPPSILGYAWVTQQRVHISAMCAMLFLCGFFVVWIYSSTLAYIVDANNGRSSTAVATNSCFRCLAAFIVTEIAVPLQDTVGDGWMYTIWAALMLISGLLVVLVMRKGGKWREAGEAREAVESKKTEIILNPQSPELET